MLKSAMTESGRLVSLYCKNNKPQKVGASRHCPFWQGRLPIGAPASLNHPMGHYGIVYIDKTMQTIWFLFLPFHDSFLFRIKTEPLGPRHLALFGHHRLNIE